MSIESTGDGKRSWSHPGYLCGRYQLLFGDALHRLRQNLQGPCSSMHVQYSQQQRCLTAIMQSGAWGCFDEFNRIELEVLSVVAQQVLAVQNAKKSNAVSALCCDVVCHSSPCLPCQRFFTFPGEVQPVPLDPVAGFFITMNPGSAVVIIIRRL
jgi:hypothetical protein